MPKKFKYKSDEQLTKMSPEERDDYAEEKREFEAELVKEAIEKGIDPIQKKMEAYDEQIKSFEKELEETKEKANKATEGGKGGFYEMIETKVLNFLTEKKDEIKKLYSQRSGVIELEIKAVGTMTAGNQVITSTGVVGTAGSATSPDGVPQLVGVQMAPPSRVNLRSTIINSLVNRFGTSLAAYPYTESLPKDGDADFTSESASKNQIDFKIETRYAQPVKITAWEHLSEESVTDIPGLQSIATGFLKDKHDIKKQRAILFGSGAGNQCKGATLYGRVFNVGSMANLVDKPNIMDVINAIATDVFTTHNFQDEQPYMPSLVLLNPVDFYLNLVAAKDGFGHPLYPQAGLFNQVTIGGMTIIPEEMIPAGKIFVADMSKYNVSDYVSYLVKIGWINDDLIKNQFVIVGESRFHSFVKHLDQQAFVYDDIATVKAAISAVV